MFLQKEKYLFSGQTNLSYQEIKQFFGTEAIAM